MLKVINRPRGGGSRSETALEAHDDRLQIRERRPKLTKLRRLGIGCGPGIATRLGHRRPISLRALKLQITRLRDADLDLRCYDARNEG